MLVSYLGYFDLDDHLVEKTSHLGFSLLLMDCPVWFSLF